MTNLQYMIRITPFLLMHVICLSVFWVGYSHTALLLCGLMYLLRLFSITAFYHRYFSHKSFKTSRLLQFVFAVIGASSTQKGPLWWAAHHRNHHRYSDTDKDEHSPLHGFFVSHVGWFLKDKNFSAPYENIKDFQKFPELRWLDRNHILIPIITLALIYALGELLFVYAPELGTNGLQLVIWGFFISTVLSTHATLSINSIAHVWGSRPYQTEDDSRNNLLLAIMTLGEGWHNNHHYYSGSVRQGFHWWQIDITYYILYLMKCLGLVWDLRPVHPKVYEQVTATTKGSH